jgi:3',5'-cyclic AMP phosphodiesterase CpdA
MFVVAHVSDTHFGNDVQDPASRAAAVMEHLLAMDPRPDVLVVTGDIADHGLAPEYAEARAWLDRWPGVVAVCPGNHDVRAAYVEGLALEPRAVVEHGDFRFVMLDSLIDAVAGERVDEGRLGADQLDWLDHRLGASDDPTFVCLHHPPTTIGLELMDPIRLMDDDELAAVLDHHPQVVATLVGHAHTMGATTFAGRPLLIGGGVVSAVTAGAEQVVSFWYDAPPSFALQLVDEQLPRVTTHWRALPADRRQPGKTRKK